jgi:GTP cyclohydrolase FolE2
VEESADALIGEIISSAFSVAAQPNEEANSRAVCERDTLVKISTTICSNCPCAHSISFLMLSMASSPEFKGTIFIALLYAL